jgi:chromosome segregation ATPase
MWRGRAEDMRMERDDACAERDNLLDLLMDAAKEYKTLDQASAETSANFHAMRDKVWGLEAERDELQSTIDEMAKELDSAKAKNRRLTRHIAQMQGGSKKWREKCEALKAENAELQEKNRHLAQKCDAMLVFLSNRAMNTTSDQERRIEKLVRQRDELRVKLKEIGDIVNG